MRYTKLFFINTNLIYKLNGKLHSPHLSFGRMTPTPKPKRKKHSHSLSFEENPAPSPTSINIIN